MPITLGFRRLGRLHPSDQPLHVEPVMALRLLSGVLALAVFAPIARAGDANPPAPVRTMAEPARSRIALRLVRVMPESHQALLFDRARATYLLVEVGGTAGGYEVEDIDDEQVTLRSGDKQIVLVASLRSDGRRYERDDRTDRDDRD